MTGGYHGKALHVHLEDGRTEVEDLSEGFLRRWVGGVGLGTALLLRHGDPAGDALAPEAVVVFALSPLVGTPLTTSAKFAVVSRSPLTGRINDAMASDRFAIELGRCGVDALVLHGRARAWSVLVIDDGDVRLEPASHLVGTSADDAEARLRERHGPAWRFFGIGPAGEAQVHFATASGDGRHAGRGGTGAVFGSKLLKGVLVRGGTSRPLHDRETVLALAKDLSARSLGAGTAKYRELGTVANVMVMNRLQALPTRNFQAGTFEGAEAISGEAFHAEAPGIRKHCAACTIGCEHIFQTRGGTKVRLEYEGVFALGPLCGIDDREVVLEAAARCDALGLDVISAGGVAAFAMECRERGLLPDAPAFGDGPGLLRLLTQIGHREGIGDLLAGGSRAAAARIGQGAEAFACHVKGLELPGYEPRALKAMAVGLATGARGADHNRSGAYEEDFRAGGDRLHPDAAKGAAAAASETKAAILDSLVLCKFLRGVFQDLPAEAAGMLRAVTGWDVTAAELDALGARVADARKLFNERAGWTRREDTLPARFLTEGLGGGEVRLSASDLDRMIATYYAARGWTPDGRLPPDRVAALGLAPGAPAA